MLEVLGEPTRREIDEEELMLEWEHAPRCIGIDFDLDGKLTCVFIDYV